MAWQRKIPFGYQVQNGRINCQPEEAKFVRSIFSHYLLGSSYSQIADEMARQGVRYHQHTAQWNKHMVKRILENERYLGMDGYPPPDEGPDLHLRWSYLVHDGRSLFPRHSGWRP